MTNLNMRNMQDHYPHRDDQVAAWIKDRRDAFCHPETGTPMKVDQYKAFEVLDNLLEEYRLAADTGMSLENVVNEEEYIGEPVTREKKKRAVEDFRGPGGGEPCV